MKRMANSSGPAHDSFRLVKTFFPHAAVFGAVLFALFLSFTNIGARSLWLDEAYSVGLTSLDWPGFWTLLCQREANMGLYFFLLKLWVGIFGSGEVAIRSLSAVFAAGAVPIIYLTGRRLFNARVGITAAFLLAANPFFIRYSQEARAYSLVLFLVSAASLFFLRLVDKPSRINRAAYICTTVLAAYSHFFALLIPVCHAVSLPFMKQKAARLRNLAPAFLTIAVLFLPLTIFILAKDSGQINWVPPVDLLSLPRLFFAFSGLVDLPTVILYAFLFPMGLFSLFQRFRKQSLSQETWQAGFTLLWLALPISIIMSASLVKPLFVTRYFIVSLPPFILITSLGLACITRKWKHHLLTAGVVVLSVNGVYTSYKASTGADWKSAATFLLSSSQPHDALFIFRDVQMIPLVYYKERYSGRHSPLVCLYPTTTLDNLLLENGASPPDRQRIRSLLENRDRTWLIICDDTPKRLFGYLSLFGTYLKAVPLSGERTENRQATALQDDIKVLYRHHREWQFERVRLHLFYDED
jgi:uncharacterized membrane protein